MSVVPYRVTREHREGLVTKAKVLSNKAKEEVRRIHNNFAKKAKAKEGASATTTPKRQGGASGRASGES